MPADNFLILNERLINRESPSPYKLACYNLKYRPLKPLKSPTNAKIPSNHFKNQIKQIVKEKISIQQEKNQQLLEKLL